MSPYRETNPYVGFSPTTPQNAAGCRTDPPVSEPSAAKQAPDATAAALPPELPPGTKNASLSSPPPLGFSSAELSRGRMQQQYSASESSRRGDSGFALRGVVAVVLNQQTCSFGVSSRATRAASAAVSAGAGDAATPQKNICLSVCLPLSLTTN